MARRGYRSDQRQVQVWLDPELLSRVDRKAERHGSSRQEAVVAALRAWLGEEVERDGVAGGRSGPRSGLAAVADGGGPRPVPGGRGEGAPRVVAADVARPLTLDERLDAGLFGAVEPALPFTDTEWVDPAEGIA